MKFEGVIDTPILFVTDFPRINCLAENKVISEGLMAPLLNAIQSAGILSAQYSMVSIHSQCPLGGQDLHRISQETRTQDLSDFRGFMRTHKANLVIPLGEYAMNLMTGLDSIQKWHCSVVPATAEFAQRKCLPLFHPSHVSKVYSDYFYLALGMQKARRQMFFPEIRIPARVFHLNPKLDWTLKYLKTVVLKAKEVSVDIETGRGQINTVGFAISPTEAIAIKTLPDGYTPEEYYILWSAIAEVLESPQPKILQNFIYEATWFARYGISMQNTVHDTMWAMKFLNPEFDKGLDNVGRLYTEFPYWKDDNDSWNNIRDWTRHLDYNCKDTTGTFAGYLMQKQALEERRLSKIFYEFVMQFAAPIQEMCIRGLLVDPQALVRLQEKLTRERDNFLDLINKDCLERLGTTINPRSPKQLKSALKQMGMKLPTQKGQESSDKKALVKLAKKHPESLILKALIGLSAKNKQLSSYVNFEYDRETNRVHYALDGCGTETGRWCLRKGTLVSCAGYEKPIENVTPGELVYCYDTHRNLQLRKVLWSGKTGNKKLIRLHWKAQSGRKGFLDLTPEHRVRMLDGSYKRAEDIQPNERTLALRRHVDEGYVSLIGLNKKYREHVFIFEHVHGYKPEVVHHIDDNKFNNAPSNLQGMTIVQHVRAHALIDGRKPPQPNEGQRARGSSAGNAKLDEAQVIQIKVLFTQNKLKLAQIAELFGVSKAAIKSIKSGKNWKHVQLNNHIITHTEDLAACDDVYDLEIEDCHNFIANEICVHNSGYKSGWGEGFNPQTVPKAVRGCFHAEPGKILVQIDLSQAESRYVAWEAPDAKLMEMLSERRDIHRYVAAQIFRCSEFAVTDKQRQLGKKSGHAANYDVGPRTFAESCLVEMDMSISESEARHILVTYEQTFPGIRRRKTNIANHLRQHRKLTTPLGRERFFYGRMDDSTFREAYAYAPQSTIPDITNHLMLGLWENRECFDCEFLLQVHDSLLLQVPINRQFEVAEFAKDLSAWHPRIELPGGTLLIPVEVEAGERWNPMQKI